eukprot:3197545-Pleurochrysis_carterae.AAC.1
MRPAPALDSPTRSSRRHLDLEYSSVTKFCAGSTLTGKRQSCACSNSCSTTSAPRSSTCPSTSPRCSMHDRPNQPSVLLSRPKEAEMESREASKTFSFYPFIKLQREITAIHRSAVDLETAHALRC